MAAHLDRRASSAAPPPPIVPTAAPRAAGVATLAAAAGGLVVAAAAAVARMTELFEHFDVNGTGWWGYDECRAACAAVGRTLSPRAFRAYCWSVGAEPRSGLLFADLRALAERAPLDARRATRDAAGRPRGGIDAAAARPITGAAAASASGGVMDHWLDGPRWPNSALAADASCWWAAPAVPPPPPSLPPPPPLPLRTVVGGARAPAAAATVSGAPPAAVSCGLRPRSPGPSRRRGGMEGRSGLPAPQWARP